MGNGHGKRRVRHPGDEEEGGIGGGLLAGGDPGENGHCGGGAAGRKGRGGGGADCLLTAQQAKDVQSCWPSIESRMEEILTDAFLALFNDDQSVRDRFFQSKSIAGASSSSASSSASSVLHRHVPAVNRALGKVVRHADRLGEVAEYLRVMGRLHHQRGVHSRDLGLLGPHFVSSSLTHLPSHLRERRHQESWLALFAACAELMRRGYPEVALEVTPQERWLLRESASALRDEVECSGADEDDLFMMSRGVVGGACGLAQVLARDATPQEEEALAAAIDGHGVLLFQVAEETLRDLEQPGRRDLLEERLREMGRAHEEAGVRSQFLDAMGPVFCQSVRHVLQARGLWGDDVREAWLRLFRLICFNMKKGYSSKGENKHHHHHKKHRHHHKHHHKHRHHHRHSNGHAAGTFDGNGEERMAHSEHSTPVRRSLVGNNGESQQLPSPPDRIVVVSSDICGEGGGGGGSDRRYSADDMLAGGGGGARSKAVGKNGSGPSVGGPDRRVRLQGQHCHLFQPSRQVRNPRYTSNLAGAAAAAAAANRRRISGSAISIANDGAGAENGRGSPQNVAQQQIRAKPLFSSSAFAGGGVTRGGLHPSRSDVDLARPHYLRTSGGGGNNRRVSSSSATNSPKFLLSPSEVGIVGTGAGVKSALLLNANAAAAEARAAEKKQRRSSLHQLLGLAVHRPGSGSASGSGQASCDEEEDGAAGGKQGRRQGRPRSKSATFLAHTLVKKC